MRALLLEWKSSSREGKVDRSEVLANPETNTRKWDEKTDVKQNEKHLAAVQMSLTGNDDRDMIDFVHFMLAGGTAKFFACSLAYPHGSFL